MVKSVFVTGATNGTGYAIAKRFARDGYAVFIGSRNGDNANSAAQKLAEEYNLYFLPLQEMLDKKAEEYAPECWLWDGVHPTRAGAKLIADEWLKLYKEKIEE